MKNILFPLIISVVVSILSLPAFAWQDDQVEENESRIQEDNLLMGDALPDERILSFKVFVSDVEDNWQLNSKFNLNYDENKLSQYLQYNYAQDGSEISSNRISYKRDSLERVIVKEIEQKLAASTEYQKTGREVFSYFKSTSRRNKIEYSTPNFQGNFTIKTRTISNYDEHGNKTSEKNNYNTGDPNNLTLYSADSTQFHYTIDLIASLKHLTYYRSLDQWLATEKWEYEWEDDILKSVTIFGGTDDAWDATKKIIEIDRVGAPSRYSVGLDWNKLSRIEQVPDGGGLWLNSLKVEKEFEEGGFKQTEKQYIKDSWQNFRQNLFSNLHRRINRLMEDNYGEDLMITDEFLKWAENTWEVDLGKRVVRSQNKSASEEIVYTLTRQIYEPGTGTWLNTHKLEVTYETTVGIDANFSLKNNIRVYPNPVIDELNISIRGLDDPLEIQIINALGQIVKTEKIDLPSTNFIYKTNMGHLKKGIYFIRAEANSRSAIIKIALK